MKRPEGTKSNAFRPLAYSAALKARWALRWPLMPEGVLRMI